MSILATSHRARSDSWVPPLQGHWTWEDYQRLPDLPGFRYEVIRGELHMSPAPRTLHQLIVTRLGSLMDQYVDRHKLGRVIVAPCDVRLPELPTKKRAGKTTDAAEHKKQDVVSAAVQPDLLFIAAARLSIITETHIDGPPDLVVEVLSPGNPGYDRQTKLAAYLDGGVREYWIIDPDARTLDVYVRRGKAYAGLPQRRPGQRVVSEVLPGFKPDVAKLWEA